MYCTETHPLPPNKEKKSNLKRPFRTKMIKKRTKKEEEEEKKSLLRKCEEREGRNDERSKRVRNEWWHPRDKWVRIILLLGNFLFWKVETTNMGSNYRIETNNREMRCEYVNNKWASLKSVKHWRRGKTKLVRSLKEKLQDSKYKNVKEKENIKINRKKSKSKNTIQIQH